MSVKRRITVTVLVLLLFILTGSAKGEVRFGKPPAGHWDRSPILRLTVFSTGQSDCMLLECGGQAMMIDGGDGSCRRELRETLWKKGITRFKYLLNTHLHEDHLTGLYQLIADGFTADAFLTAENAARTDPLQRMTEEAAESRKIPIERIRSGDELLLGEAVLELYRYDGGRSVNGRSVVTRVTFGDCTLLLTADIIGDTQTRLLKEKSPEWLKADVMKAPHHAVTPMTGGFLRAVNPSAVLITNSPARARECADQLKGEGIPALYSGEGRITLETDGDVIYIDQTPGGF